MRVNRSNLRFPEFVFAGRVRISGVGSDFSIDVIDPRGDFIVYAVFLT